MNKKGKEGGSTWFNPRQTEIPLFKINKKKKKKRQTGPKRRDARGKWLRSRALCSRDRRGRLGRTRGEGPGELGTIKVLVFRVCASRCLGLGASFSRAPPRPRRGQTTQRDGGPESLRSEPPGWGGIGDSCGGEGGENRLSRSGPGRGAPFLPGRCLGGPRQVPRRLL